MTEMILVYLTAASPEEADWIGEALVSERLAACVNRIDGMRSLFHWEGVIDRATETVLLAKTRRTLFEPLAARVRALHSYTTPCILAVPIVLGDPDYLAWLTRETEPPAADG